MNELKNPKDLLKLYRLSPEELERQVAEICGTIDMDAALYSGETRHHSTLDLEEVIQGRVVDIRKDEVLVDYGGKCEARLPYKESGSSNEDLDIGDETQFLVTAVDSEGDVQLSRQNVELLVKQREVLSKLNVGDEVRGILIQKTKTGWIVNVDSLPAILPGAVEFLVYDKPEELLDTEIVAEIDSIDDKIVTLSRKKYASKVKKEAKASFFNALNIDDLVEGFVKNITEFGAFIQIASGVIGLCHSSDIGEEELKVGKKVKCRILKIDREKNRVSLGIRQVTEPSWAEVMAKYGEEQRVTATVKSIVPYGAFLELEPGVSGLVHVSDLSWSEHVKHPKEILSEGDQIEVLILSIDVDKQHLSFGLKQVNEDPWLTIQDRYLIGAVYEGTVTNKTKFGIFVELESGVEGLAHHTINSESLPRGAQVSVSILRVDAARKKIALGLE